MLYDSHTTTCETLNVGRIINLNPNGDQKLQNVT